MIVNFFEKINRWKTQIAKRVTDNMLHVTQENIIISCHSERSYEIGSEESIFDLDPSLSLRMTSISSQIIALEQ